tara:strand:+ start:94 stop:273 length:180 start_codon:yes stop_codon:yes gene_type:complete
MKKERVILYEVYSALELLLSTPRREKAESYKADYLKYNPTETVFIKETRGTAESDVKYD